MELLRMSSAVAVWVLVFLCAGTVSADETEAAAQTTSSPASAACPKTTSAMLRTAAEMEGAIAPPTSVESGKADRTVSTSQRAAAEDEIATVLAVEAERGQCPDSPTMEKDASIIAKLNGTWQVVAGYSREFLTKAFCPELTLRVDSNSTKITVLWRNAAPYQEVIPQGEMTMLNTQNLTAVEGFDEIKVVKLAEFLVIRVCNPKFRRLLILSRVMDPYILELQHDIHEFIVPMHEELQRSDGPAWFVCAQAHLRLRKSAEHD